MAQASESALSRVEWSSAGVEGESGMGHVWQWCLVTVRQAGDRWPSHAVKVNLTGIFLI